MAASAAYGFVDQDPYSAVMTIWRPEMPVPDKRVDENPACDRRGVPKNLSHGSRIGWRVRALLSYVSALIPMAGGIMLAGDEKISSFFSVTSKNFLVLSWVGCVVVVVVCSVSVAFV